MSYCDDYSRRMEIQDWQEATLMNETLKAVHDVLSNQKPQTQQNDEGTKKED